VDELNSEVASMSRAWAVVGLLLYIGERVYEFYVGPAVPPKRLWGVRELSQISMKVEEPPG
jgi:hypothetical protein